jgi:hypothetical protein
VNRDQLSSLLELLGVVAVLVAAFATDWRLGIAVVGVCLVWSAICRLAVKSEHPSPAHEATHLRGDVQQLLDVVAWRNEPHRRERVARVGDATRGRVGVRTPPS